MSNYIALDVGGTNIKYGVVNDLGEVLIANETETEAKKGGNNLILKISNLIEKLLNESKYDIVGIGISSAGQISPKTGKVLYASDNIPGWTGMEIKKIIEDKFNMPVYVDNDVNCAALGEKWIGAGKGAENFICATIGTGIGGAIIINNELYYGANGSAGEFGHMNFIKDGRECTCGRRGCFEQYASTSALIRYAEELIYKERNIQENLNGKILFDRAKEGDAICNKAIEWFVDNLAYGLSGLIHIFNPSLIVIGGGISKQGNYLLDKIYDKIKVYTMQSYMSNLTIKFAECGNLAGMLGATYGLIKF